MLRNRMKTLTVGCLAGIAGSSAAGLTETWVGPGVAQADIIVGYGSENSEDGTPALDVFAGVSPMSLMRGEGLNSGSGNTYNSSGWTDEATDFLQWGWTSSLPLDLTELDLRYDRSGSGPSMVDIQLAVNGGGFQSVFQDPDVSATGEDVTGIDLTSFTQVTSATFRLFGASASSASGTFDIEPLTGLPDRGIVVSGTMATVPEPGGLQLMAAAFVSLMATRARLRRSRNRGN